MCDTLNSVFYDTCNNKYRTSPYISAYNNNNRHTQQCNSTQVLGYSEILLITSCATIANILPRSNLILVKPAFIDERKTSSYPYVP